MSAVSVTDTRRARLDALRAGAPQRRESESGIVPKYPATRWLRWVVRVAYAAPFAGIAVATNLLAPPELLAHTSNGALLARLEALDLAALGPTAMVELFPPLTSAIAFIAPNALALGVLGAFAAGILIQLVVQWLCRRGMRRVHRLLLGFGLAATPTFAFVATTDLEGMLGVTFLGLGVIEVVRFIKFANTQAGFRSGLLLACAALSNSAAIVSVLVAAVILPFLRHSRRRSWPANAFVIAFPTLATVVGVIVLDVLFGGNPALDVFSRIAFSQSNLDSLLIWLSGPAGPLFLAPTLIGVVLAFILQRPVNALLAPLLTLNMFLAHIMGLTTPGSAGVNMVLLILVGVAVTPGNPARWQRIWIAVFAVLLLLDGWLLAFQIPTLVSIMDVLFGWAIP